MKKFTAYCLNLLSVMVIIGLWITISGLKKQNQELSKQLESQTTDTFLAIDLYNHCVYDLCQVYHGNGCMMP
jgi:hypothetical protein